MRPCLVSVLPEFQHIFFDNAQEMIEWLGDHLAQVVLISLDFDLPDPQIRNVQRVVPGDGRMVADFLCGVTPTCPVIVHSSNEIGAAGMLRVLRDADWASCRVRPVDEYRWIGTTWASKIHDYIQRGWIFDLDGNPDSCT
jgi:hypothetical protein